MPVPHNALPSCQSYNGYTIAPLFASQILASTAILIINSKLSRKPQGTERKLYRRVSITNFENMTIIIQAHSFSTQRYPNNPDGAKRTPLVTDPDRIITDMVYYWPMYANIDEEMNESIMVFSR